MPNPYNAAIPITAVSDGHLIKNTLKNIKIASPQGKNLNTSNRFSGDFSKIKNVHFIKGTYFDRSYFRRLYPNINIRNNLDLAEVIIYDDKAIFENDKKPTCCLKIKNTDIYFHPNEFNRLRMAFRPSTYEYNVYNKFLSLDKNNSKIIGQILDPTIESEYAYLSVENDYFDKLESSKLPYMLSDDALNKIPSNSKQDDLSISDLIVYIEQLTSGNYSVICAALDSLIMYNSDKFAPIQYFLYLLTISKNTCMYQKKNSTKLDLFLKSVEGTKVFGFKNYTLPTDFISVLNLFVNIVDDFDKSNYNIDWEICKQFMNEPTLFKKLNHYIIPHIDVNHISFTCKHPKLKEVQAPVTTASAASEFML